MTNMMAMKPIILCEAQKKCMKPQMTQKQESKIKKKKSVSCITHYIEKTNFKIELTTDTFQSKNQQLKNWLSFSL